MRYTGTTCYPGPTPDTRRLRIRNRGGLRAVLATADAERLRPYELYMDKADNLLVQNLLGTRWKIEFSYSIENLLASASPLVG